MTDKGFYLSYSPDRMRQESLPETPFIDDVFYVLRMGSSANKGRYYHKSPTPANHEWYIANVHLVAAAVAAEVRGMQPYHKGEARRMIAKAIIALCSQEARCFLNNAFWEAKQIVGDDVPAKTLSAPEIKAQCSCPSCRYD